MTNTALLLIDIQNDYFPGGAFEQHDMATAANNAAALLAHFREKDLPLIHVRHESLREGASFFLPGTPGADIHESVAPNDSEPVVQKNFPNSFRQTKLQEILKEKGIENLVICGAMSLMCIDATTRAAADMGYNVSVAEDACGARELSFKDKTIPAPQVHGAFMAALGMGYAEILTTRDYLLKNA